MKDAETNDISNESPRPLVVSWMVGKLPVRGVMMPLEAYCRSLGNEYKRTGSSVGRLRPQPVLGEVLLQAASSVCFVCAEAQEPWCGSRCSAGGS